MNLRSQGPPRNKQSSSKPKSAFCNLFVIVDKQQGKFFLPTSRCDTLLCAHTDPRLFLAPLVG